jgi:hypothetical protein
VRQEAKRPFLETEWGNAIRDGSSGQKSWFLDIVDAIGLHLDRQRSESHNYPSINIDVLVRVMMIPPQEVNQLPSKSSR